jgi:hypothetical protein
MFVPPTTDERFSANRQKINIHSVCFGAAPVAGVNILWDSCYLIPDVFATLRPVLAFIQKIVVAPIGVMTSAYGGGTSTSPVERDTPCSRLS